MTKLGFKYHERDLRPAKGGWAPGLYICLCSKCQNQFFGEKRAYRCADCEYETIKFKDIPRQESIHGFSQDED